MLHMFRYIIGYVDNATNFTARFAPRHALMKLHHLTIKAFRGIPGELHLHFRQQRQDVLHSCSALIFGDNGTGKSSIVDAIELALQARMRRSKRFYIQHYASPLSYATQLRPSIVATLDDGTTVRRDLMTDADGLYESDPTPLPGFSFSPIVLRRTDILRFFETPESERQLIFFDFLQSPGEGWNTIPQEDILDHNTRRLTLRKRRNELRRQIAKWCEEDPTEMPKSFNRILRTVYAKTFGEIPEDEWDGHVLEDFKGYIDAPTYETLDNLRSTMILYKEAQSEFSRLKLLPTQKTARADIPDLLGRLGDDITQAFKSITHNTFVKGIDVSVGRLSTASLSLVVRLENGRQCEPQQIFSEANLDLLALVVYVSILKESARRGQGKVLVLDDVFQSVDSTIRSATLEYLVSSLKDWQFILTLHDRLWLAQVGGVLRRYSIPFIEHHILRWRFDVGPVFSESVRSTESALVDALRSGDVVAVCSNAGLVLEEIANRMSWTLPISITRRKDDKYTLGDLWPGVLKALKKTSVVSLAAEADRHMQLRNLVGAHYNEWARSLSGQEAEEFGVSVLSLLHSVRCSTCCSWVEAESCRNDAWTCHCKATSINKVK